MGCRTSGRVVSNIFVIGLAGGISLALDRKTCYVTRWGLIKQVKGACRKDKERLGQTTLRHSSFPTQDAPSPPTRRWDTAGHPMGSCNRGGVLVISFLEDRRSRRHDLSRHVYIYIYIYLMFAPLSLSAFRGIIPRIEPDVDRGGRVKRGVANAPNVASPLRSLRHRSRGP